MKKILLLFSIAFLMVFSSCMPPRILYKVPKKPKESVAIVKRDLETTNKKRCFRKYDNTWIINVSSTSTTIPEDVYHGPALSYEVLPGNYLFTIGISNELSIWDDSSKAYYFDNNFYVGYYQVTFNAEAGKTYVICSDADHEKREVDIYVKDEKSGERVESTVVEIERYKLKSKE